jgi:hypothetical protein
LKDLAALKSSRSRSFASPHKKHATDESIVCSAQDGAFMRIEIGDSGYSNPRTTLDQFKLSILAIPAILAIYTVFYFFH